MSQSVIGSEKSGEAVQLPQALALLLVLERCVGPLATHNALLAFLPPYAYVELSLAEILSSIKHLDRRAIPHLAVLLSQKGLTYSNPCVAFWLGIVGTQAVLDRPITPYEFLVTCNIFVRHYLNNSSQPDPLYAPILVDLARRVEIFNNPSQVEHFAFVEAPLYYFSSSRLQTLVVMWSALALANLLSVERTLLEIAKFPFYATIPFLPAARVLLENGSGDARRLFDLWQAAYNSRIYFEPKKLEKFVSVLATFDSSEVASTARASLALLPAYASVGFDNNNILRSWTRALGYKNVSSLLSLVIHLANCPFGMQVMQRIATLDKELVELFKTIYARSQKYHNKHKSRVEAFKTLTRIVLQSRPIVIENRYVLEEFINDQSLQGACRILPPELAQHLDAHFRNAANYFGNLRSLARTALDIIMQISHHHISLAEVSHLAEHAYAELQKTHLHDIERVQSLAVSRQSVSIRVP